MPCVLLNRQEEGRMMVVRSTLAQWAILFVVFPLGYTQPVFGQIATKYCNAVQNNVGLIRYPLGTIAASVSGPAETADAMTLVPRVYPCLNSVVVRGEKDKWISSVSGDPSTLVVQYQTDKPCGATTTAITVTPHVSVFRVTFPSGAKNKYLIFDFTKFRVDDWAALYKWTERTVTRVDDRTVEATIGEPGKRGAYYHIRFGSPCLGSGTIDSSGAIADGATTISGSKLGMYARFDVSTVTVAIAESFTSMPQAAEFLTSEFTNFDDVRARCLAAWNEILGRLEVEGTENSKRMAYSALYTMIVNVIDGSSGSWYSKYTPRPRSLASSAYWQFIGGFQSCCWDNHRAAYPFLMLGYPEVMSDIVGTYLARYQRDGFVSGDICLFTGPTGGHASVRLSPVLIAEAYACGIQADYSRLYAALKDNYANDRYVPGSVYELGYETQPESGGKACSQTLEWSTSFSGLALLAKANKDQKEMSRYLSLSKSYANVWDSTSLAFRVRKADRSWGVIDNKTWTWNPNPQGLFEGTTNDWSFAVPHDPYGLINLPGQKQFVGRVVSYCANDTWFNDYQYVYPYLLYYADAANQAQRILRRVWVPLFHEGVMYEGVSPQPSYKPWNTHYTSNAGWLMCSMIGLYPTFAPAGQYIITSPSLDKTVIHRGGKSITVEARNSSGENIYIRSIKVDGKAYPCYMIPAKRLGEGIKINLEMGRDSTEGLGKLFVSSTDGYVHNAELVSPSHLRCTIEAAIENATTMIHSRTKPEAVMVNGVRTGNWSYDEEGKSIRISSEGTVLIEVICKEQ
jgi:predicted alpha-1,2-mannosidase